MNKKGNIPILSLFFSLIVFNIVWAVFLAGWLNQEAANMISVNSLTGIEAFLIANINLWLLIFEIILIMAYAYIAK